VAIKTYTDALTQGGAGL